LIYFIHNLAIDIPLSFSLLLFLLRSLSSFTFILFVTTI